MARGHEVTIFAAGFDHGIGREARLRTGELYRTQWFDGVRYAWLRTYPYRGNSWRRQVNMLSYLVVAVVVQARFTAPDTVIGSTVHPFAALGGWLVARFRGARFLFEVRDLWPQTLVDLGALRVGSPGERLLRMIEAFLVRRASVVITLLPGMRDYLVERGLPAKHVVYIPNGVDLAAFDAPPTEAEKESESVSRSLDAIRVMRSTGRIVVGYVGAFGRVNHVEVIIRAAAIAEARSPGRVGLVLIGDGPEKSRLERCAASNQAISFGPSVPKRYVPIILHALDAGVVHATATPVYRYGISFNKLFEYMAASRPVVFACTSSYDPITSAGAGISIRPDDPEGLAGAFLHLADMAPEMHLRMGAAGRAYVDAEHDMDRLGEVLASVVSDRLRTD